MTTWLTRQMSSSSPSASRDERSKEESMREEAMLLARTISRLDPKTREKRLTKLRAMAEERPSFAALVELVERYLRHTADRPTESTSGSLE